VTEEPEVVETVTTETAQITSSIQSALTGSRVAGGSISSSSDAGADAGGGGDSAGGSASDAAASSSTTASADDSGGDSAADEGGDEESSESASSGGSGSVGGANVLVDTSNIGSGGQQIDTPVTSSGNSSLWSGEDGLGETPGGDQ
jgi:hypothetical protein